MADRHEIEFSGRNRPQRTVDARRRIVHGRRLKQEAIGVAAVLTATPMILLAVLGVFIERLLGFEIPESWLLGALGVGGIFGLIAWLRMTDGGDVEIERGLDDEWAEEGGSSEDYLQKP